MSSVSWEVQKAIYAVLAADAPLSAALTGGVHDDVDENYNIFPYLTMGEDNATEWDTDNTEGFVVTLPVHIWSREKGQKEIKTLQGLVYDALHRVSLTVDGFNCVLCRQTDQISMRDPDGLTRHSSQTYELILGS